MRASHRTKQLHKGWSVKEGRGEDERGSGGSSAAWGGSLHGRGRGGEEKPARPPVLPCVPDRAGKHYNARENILKLIFIENLHT